MKEIKMQITRTIIREFSAEIPDNVFNLLKKTEGKAENLSEKEKEIISNAFEPIQKNLDEVFEQGDFVLEFFKHDIFWDK